MLGLIQIQAGDHGEAIASFRRAIELGDHYPQVDASLANAYARHGNRAAAFTVLEGLRKRSAHEYIPPFAYALVYAGLGDVTNGVDWLLKGVVERDIFMPENFYDPMLDPLRKDPRFGEVERKMGLRR